MSMISHRIKSLCTRRDVNSELSAFLAFIIPLTVRAFPEILMGDYITGFDIISYYVPVTLRWVSSGVNIWEFIGCAPFFYSLLSTFVLIGVPLSVSLKILPPLMHGFLGLAVYFYADKSLAWSSKWSLFTSFLATLYFVSLRISWDMLRCELSLIFLFAFLITLNKCLNCRQWKSFGLLSFCMILVVLTHQLVAVTMLVIVLAVFLKTLRIHDYDKARRFLLSSLPAATLFMLVIYAYFVVLPSTQVVRFVSSRAEYLALFGYSSVHESLVNALGFLIYCYLPLLPFLYLGIRNLNLVELKAWSVWCLIAVLFSFFVPSAPFSYRWILLLAFPMVFFAVKGFKQVNSRFCKEIWVALLVSLSFSFIFLPAEMAFPYFRIFPYYIPSSMLQNSVPLRDCADVVKVLNWIEANAEDNAVLLVHAAFYGWALLCLDDNDMQIVSYGYANPEEAAEVVCEAGCSRSYLIWWISGEGWHDLASPPSCFVEVFRSGKIAAYEYVEV